VRAVAMSSNLAVGHRAWLFSFCLQYYYLLGTMQHGCICTDLSATTVSSSLTVGHRYCIRYCFLL
jgi:hypothetical protein